MTSPTLIFGGATIGQNFPNASSVQALLDLLKHHKISHIDTAARYPPGKFGLSETLLGEVQAAEQGFSISTKIFTNPAAGNGEGELSREAIESSLAGSLGRLKVKQVDILYCHRPDPKTPLLEQAAALDSQYRKGAFRRLGLSNYSPKQVRDFVRVCEENSFVKPTVYQGDYNLVTRGMESELLPTLKELKLNFYAFRPLAAGFLTGTYTLEPQSDAPSQTRFSSTNPLGKFFRNLYGDPQLHEAMAELKSILAPLGISSRSAALRWICWHSALEGAAVGTEDTRVMENPEKKRGGEGGGDAIILGASRLEQMSENVGSIEEGKLPEQVVDSIEKIWTVLKESRGAIL
ncbi:hypothetical protein CJF30_00004831 [Rutstroemia sp. NJR-2017a BBW]|nr:hypothetical protein CJF30_00004831 [Rutstroemia sp. NJR-2017a BBW]